MKRDMKKLEDEAATSAKSAESEKQHSLKLEKDLQVLAAELAKVKKESAEAKKAAQKAHTDLRAVLDVCQKGIKAMCHHIFGADSPKLKLPTSQQLHSVLDHCHGLQEGARSVVKYLNSKGKYPKEPERLVDELSRAPGYMHLWKQSAMRRSAIRILALAHSYYPTVLEPAMLTMGKPEQHEDGKPFTQDDFKAEELLVRPYACEIANKMDPEVWVHHYDLENKRVNPGVPPIVNFGRPSQDMTGAPSTGPSSSTPAAPRTGDLTGAEPTLKTPAAPTPSRVATGGSQIQEELSKHMKNPRGTGYQTKKVATKSPGKSTSASAAQAKDKSPAKDSTAPVKDSIPVKDNSLDDF